MKTSILTFFVLLSFSISGVEAQEEVPPSSFIVNLSLDNAFGFNPSVYGSFGIAPQLSLSYYGIFWTNPAFGTLIDGTDAWLELGLGVGYTILDNRLSFNPFVGITNGRLLSDSPRGALAEGLVPGLGILFKDQRFEGEFNLSYYKAIKNEGLDSGDYLLYWFLPGVAIHRNISLGLHYESFILTRINRGDSGTQYEWLGAYLKFTVGDRYAFRFSAGANTAKNGIYSDQFYKLTVVIPML